MDTPRGLQRKFNVCTIPFLTLLQTALCTSVIHKPPWQHIPHFLSGINLKLNRQAFVFKIKNNSTKTENMIVLLEPECITD